MTIMYCWGEPLLKSPELCFGGRECPERKLTLTALKYTTRTHIIVCEHLKSFWKTTVWLKLSLSLSFMWSTDFTEHQLCAKH